VMLNDTAILCYVLPQGQIRLSAASSKHSLLAKMKESSPHPAGALGRPAASGSLFVYDSQRYFCRVPSQKKQAHTTDLQVNGNGNQRSSIIGSQARKKSDTRRETIYFEGVLFSLSCTASEEVRKSKPGSVVLAWLEKCS
jgi:hypothetical protein